jgi:hypothetical protein
MRSAFQSSQAASQHRTSGNTMASVRIAKPFDVGFADWMSQLRDWLDQHGIEPAGFKCHDAGLDNQTYEVSFPNQGQADLFAAKFNESIFSKKL